MLSSISSGSIVRSQTCLDRHYLGILCDVVTLVVTDFNFFLFLPIFIQNGTGSLVSIKWDDVCRPKSQGGLGLKSMHEWNVSLMVKHLWNIITDKDTIWIKWVKIHKIKGKNLWDIELNKVAPRGPLSKLIDHRVIYLAGLDINAKVIDLIENNNWCCPIDWMTEYDTVIDVPVLTLNNDVEDRIIWCNKKGKEKDFSASEV
nr:hypothetical protein [Tanacetum cinerariifolium]